MALSVISSIFPTGVGTIYNIPISAAKLKNNYELYIKNYELFIIFAP